MLDAGIDQFSMIHDSYGCSAPYTSLMREYTKEEFMMMHQDNLLLKLKKEIEAKLKIELPDCPITNNLDIGSVLEADYLFQ
jgi:DNA-directed RNA polymerase